MKQNNEPSWSALYRRRREAAERLGAIFDLPIRKRVGDILLEVTTGGGELLEVGAGERKMEQLLHRAGRKIHYESIDIDPFGKHDYRSLEQISKQYDIVCAFEVIEHLELSEIVPWLRRLGELLKPGGKLLLSTPNTYYPPAYLRDATHRTPLCYDELAGLTAEAGLNVPVIYRIYNDPVHRKILRRYFFGWMFRMIGIDFARQIVLLGEKSNT